MLNAGDLHNFGKQVRFKIDPKRGPAYFKPRSIFWERQFLSSESLLRTALRKDLGFDPLSPLGSVWFDSEDDNRTGMMEPVHNDGPSHPNLISSFAQVSAIATAFGLVDLHVSNCVPAQAGRFALIDIECPFFETGSLAETGLISRKTLPPEKAGAAHLSEIIAVSGADTAAHLLNEHFNYFEVINRSAVSIVSCIEALPLHQVPIRVILRATRDYTSTPHFSEPLLAEEIKQLDRGDIPYFFKFLGDTSLYYHDSETTFARVPEQGGRLWDAVRRSAMSSESLFTADRLQKLKYQSTLMFATRLCRWFDLEHIETERLELRKGADNLVLRLGNVQLEGRMTS